MTSLTVYMSCVMSEQLFQDKYVSYGSVLRYGSYHKTLYEVSVGITMQEMILKGVVEALGTIKNKEIPIKLYTSMSYIYQPLAKGYLNDWQKNGWQTKQKQPLKYDYLWKKVLHLIKSFSFFSCHLVSSTSQITGMRYSKYLAKKAIYSQPENELFVL